MEIMLFISILYLPFLNTCKIFLHAEKKKAFFLSIPNYFGFHIKGKL